jgi:hypothetical protein
MYKKRDTLTSCCNDAVATLGDVISLTFSLHILGFMLVSVKFLAPLTR